MDVIVKTQVILTR